MTILLLAALLAAGAIVLGGGEQPAPDPVPRERIATIERRVEQLRGLAFRRPVPVAVVSPEQARRTGIAEYDRTQPAARERAGEELLKLLGLLPPDADMRRITSAIFAEQVAGYYDPRTRRLALVRGVGVDDITLAHELTHALEDQHFDLSGLGEGRDQDAATAEQALAEGTATLVMDDYMARWPSGIGLGDALAGLTQVTEGTPLPPYVLRSMLFPYFQGEGFARALREAGGGWRLVDVALRDRPPRTTAEILDPDRWLRAERPAPVALGAAPPAGFRRIAGSTLGEEDVAALLAPSHGPLAARRLAEGWAGGRYVLWRRGPLVDPACAAPCRARDAFAMAVRTETPAQARALAGALRVSLPAGTVARVTGATVRVSLGPR